MRSFLRRAGAVAGWCISCTLWPLPAQSYSELLERTKELLKAQKVDEALPYARRAFEKEPFNDKASFLLARILLLGSDSAHFRDQCREADRLLAESARTLEGVSERGEDLGYRYFYLGLARWFCGDPMQAVSAFQKSYRADFQRSDALFNQHAVLEELGKRTEADVAWQIYLKSTKKRDKD